MAGEGQLAPNARGVQGAGRRRRRMGRSGAPGAVVWGRGGSEMGRKPGLKGLRGAGGLGAAGWGRRPASGQGRGGPTGSPFRGSASRGPGWVTPQLVASSPPLPGCHRPLTPRAAAGGRCVAARWRVPRQRTAARGGGRAQACLTRRCWPNGSRHCPCVRLIHSFISPPDGGSAPDRL